MISTDKKQHTGLKKKMIFYFLMIAIANIFVAGEFVWQLKSDSYRNKIASELVIEKNKAHPETYIYSILDNLAQRFMIMIVVLIIVSAVVLSLFVLQIASPLQYMINMAEKMSDGDLSLRIDIKTDDEIAILGKLINDLSINQQEIVAQLERLVTDLDHAILQYKIIVRQFPNIQSYFYEETIVLDEVLTKFKMLKDMYVLFTIGSMIKNISTGDNNENK